MTQSLGLGNERNLVVVVPSWLGFFINVILNLFQDLHDINCFTTPLEIPKQVRNDTVKFINLSEVLCYNSRHNFS